MPSGAETVSYGLGRNGSLVLHFTACFLLLLLFLFHFIIFILKAGMQIIYRL
jgi:hypothetical protein